jgi:hypothetical protein
MHRSLHYRNGKWNRAVTLDEKPPPEEETTFINQIRDIIRELKK